jgi:hypothetical protein
METKTTRSNTYGEYIITKIGIISVEKGFDNGMSVDDVFDWFEKFHPKIYFGSYSSKHIDKWNFELWLPLKKNNPKLKIAVSDEKLERWKNNATSMLIIES